MSKKQNKKQNKKDTFEIKKINFEEYWNKSGNQINKLFEITLNQNKGTTNDETSQKLLDSLKKVNNILEKIDLNKGKIRNFENEANLILSDVSDCLTFCEDIFSENDASPEVQKLYNQVLNKYRRLEFLIVNHKFNSMKDYNKTLENRIENQKEILKKETEKSEQIKKEQEKLSVEIFSKIESLGSNTLNMILTISLVTASVAVIAQISNPIYIPMFIMTITWLLLSCVMFNAGLFKKDDNFSSVSKLCICLYIVLTIGSVLCTIFTCFKVLS